jgi:hypothetical protein
MTNIVTSVCVDTVKNSKVEYPSLSGNEDKRIVYWRCAATFCMTSIRFNKKERHIVFTNDKNLDQITIDGYKVKDMLSNLGVEIIELSFDEFDPKDYSKRFRNAFYKHEVIHALSKLDKPSILLDADCIWTRRDDSLFEIINDGKYLLLQDTYQRCSTPKLKSPHNLSMEDMSELYKKIPLMKTQIEFPVWYGGELIGGSPEQFKIVAKWIHKVLRYCKEQESIGNKLVFNNGDSIFSNDEFISSYVYQSLTDIPVYDTFGRFSKRIWSLDTLYNVEKNDINLPIWHLPAEKETGLKKLFYRLVDSSSDFWTSNDSMSQFLGMFFNIPKRKVGIATNLKTISKLLLTKCKNTLKRILH